MTLQQPTFLSGAKSSRPFWSEDEKEKQLRLVKAFF